MRAWVLILLLLPFAAAHTALDPNASTHDHPLQCNPADEISEGGASWIAIVLILAAVILTFAALRTNTLLTFLGVLMLIGALVYAWHSFELNSYTVMYGVPGSTHVHADFAVMVNNQLVDFSDDRYMTYQNHEQSIYVHLHDPDNVVHVHATGVTWEYFFKTIGVHLDGSCLQVQNESVCNAVFIRNNTLTPSLLTEPIAEGDRVLFHYGKGNASALFEQAVGNRSCMHSGTCPERGFLPGCNS